MLACMHARTRHQLQLNRGERKITWISALSLRNNRTLCALSLVGTYVRTRKDRVYYTSTTCIPANSNNYFRFFFSRIGRAGGRRGAWQSIQNPYGQDRSTKQDRTDGKNRREKKERKKEKGEGGRRMKENVVNLCMQLF